MMMAMPMALFPFFAAVLHAPHAVGLLYAADSVGALLAGPLPAGSAGCTGMAWRSSWLPVGWGAAMGLAGLMPNLALVLVLLAVAGAADMVSGTFRGAIWDQTIPDELRGRLAGIELLSYSIGPTLGNARAGFMAVRASGLRSVPAARYALLGVAVAGTAAAAAAPL